MASQEMIERNLRLKGAKLEPRPERESKGLKKSGGSLKGTSKPMPRGRFKEVPDARRGYWHGVMCTKLRAQEREEGFDGFYGCMCGDPDCDAVIEGFDDARRYFVPGHIKPRAEFNDKGFRLTYTPTLGPDDPDNIVPVTPECNKAEFWRRVG